MVHGAHDHKEMWPLERPLWYIRALSVFQTGPQQGAKSKKKRCAKPTKICVALPLATVLCELAVRPANDIFLATNYFCPWP
eukprot:s953_g25.t1